MISRGAAEEKMSRGEKKRIVMNLLFCSSPRLRALRVSA
jgi:hypothetical protein